MKTDIEVPAELKDVGADRIRTWRQWGVEAVRTELIRGGTGLGLNSGSDAVKEMAWRWIAYEEKRLRLSDAIEVKPSMFGVSVDGKKLWAIIKDRLNFESSSDRND